MSDEQRIDEQDEVEGHKRFLANDDPTAQDEDENDVEGHARITAPRVDAPRVD